MLESTERKEKRGRYGGGGGGGRQTGRETFLLVKIGVKTY